MKDNYTSFEEYCSDFHRAEKSGQKNIINGWDCTYLPPKTIEVVTQYDSMESLLADFTTNGEFLPKFNMYQCKGIRIDLAKDWCLKKKDGSTEHCVHIEGCHYPGNFVIMPLRRTAESDTSKAADHGTITKKEITMSEKQNKTPESRLRATQKWQTANYKNVRLVFHKTTEADMIEWIEKQPNKLQYIKDLIRADMNKEK